MSNKRKKKSIISELLDSLDKVESAKIERKMDISAKIYYAMKSKGWRKKDLMEALDRKSQSDVTKWLSGTHNFTSDTLVELEQALDINLFDLDFDEVNEKAVVIRDIEIDDNDQVDLPDYNDKYSEYDNTFFFRVNNNETIKTSNNNKTKNKLS